jgi:YaaC-like Protein
MVAGQRYADPVLDEEKLVWFAVRGRRASMRGRPKLSDTAGREHTFAAAMAQFEEQYIAAKVVTEFTRPLNLYYGLAQAGMAIAAARADDPWSFSRHGLRLDRQNDQLAGMKVIPDGEGGFQKVATATGSPLISGPVSLGALWASLPDPADVGSLAGSDEPLPIPLVADETPASAPSASLFLPQTLLARDLVVGPAAWLERFTEIMKAYPGAERLGIRATQGSVSPPQSEEENWRIDVTWLDAQSPRDIPAAELKAFFDRIAPEYRYRGDRFLRPAIAADGTPAPSPLMTWWLLLYSFSILARYEPRKWAKLLDLDKTRTAVRVQYALNEALTAVPQLVVEALDGEPFLLAKPMHF